MTSPPLEAVDVKVDVTGLEDRTRVVEDVLVGVVVPRQSIMLVSYYYLKKIFR